MKILPSKSVGLYCERYFKMHYFNGFSLKNEQSLFAPYLFEGDYTVAGFSYGAQQALEYVYHTRQKVQRLQLFSPAFFQTEKKSFTRTQLRYFEVNNKAYIEQFLSNVAYPSTFSLKPYVEVGQKEALEALLGYVWEREKLQSILNRGIEIEVFLGQKDKIINVESTFDFFSDLTATYLITDVGHLLVQ